MFLMHLSFDGEVLLPAPSWVSYKPQSIIAKNNYHWIKTSAENNWFPLAREIEKIVIKNLGKKYILFLNSPNNPSGQVCKNLNEISEIIKKYNILVLSDEIYSELAFEENYISIFEHCPEQVIISNGLSKWCGAGGWRLGYFIIPKTKIDLIKSIKVLASETFSAVSSPIQYAAISAFQDKLSGIGEKGDDIISADATVIVKYALPLAVIIAIIYALYKAYNYFADDDEENNIKETASSGATSAGAIASVANPISARAKIKRDRTGVPKAPQKKNTDGTAKNALDMSNNLMGGATIRR